ncbi:hypothetical protein MDAP_002033 [Mitosporidium daphniae]
MLNPTEQELKEEVTLFSQGPIKKLARIHQTLSLCEKNISNTREKLVQISNAMKVPNEADIQVISKPNLMNEASYDEFLQCLLRLKEASCCLELWSICSAIKEKHSDQIWRPYLQPSFRRLRTNTQSCIQGSEIPKKGNIDRFLLAKKPRWCISTAKVMRMQWLMQEYVISEHNSKFLSLIAKIITTCTLQGRVEKISKDILLRSIGYFSSYLAIRSSFARLEIDFYKKLLPDATKSFISVLKLIIAIVKAETTNTSRIFPEILQSNDILVKINSCILETLTIESNTFFSKVKMESNNSAFKTSESLKILAELSEIVSKESPFDIFIPILDKLLREFEEHCKELILSKHIKHLSDLSNTPPPFLAPNCKLPEALKTVFNDFLGMAIYASTIDCIELYDKRTPPSWIHFSTIFNDHLKKLRNSERLTIETFDISFSLVDLYTNASYCPLKKPIQRALLRLNCITYLSDVFFEDLSLLLYKDTRNECQVLAIFRKSLQSKLAAVTENAISTITDPIVEKLNEAFASKDSVKTKNALKGFYEQFEETILLLNSIVIENPKASASITCSIRDHILAAFNSFLAKFKIEIIEHPKWLQMSSEQLIALLDSPFEK